jgi:hypothetical protein
VLHPIGWSATSVPEPAGVGYAEVLAELAPALVLWCRAEQANPVRSRNPRVNSCAPDAKVEPNVAVEGPISPSERARKQRWHPPRALDPRRQLADRRQRLVQAGPQLAVQPRRPAGDGGHEHRPARSDHPPSLPQRPQPLVAAAEMVDRTKQQHGVHGAVAEV